MSRRLLAPLFWAALIFVASSVPGDELPSPGFLHLDKLIHAGAYAVLGWLVARALSARSRGALFAAACLATLYGMTDELHQGFVPGRDPDVGDAAADALGAVLGVLVWRAAIRRRSARS